MSRRWFALLCCGWLLLASLPGFAAQACPFAGTPTTANRCGWRGPRFCAPAATRQACATPAPCPARTPSPTARPTAAPTHRPESTATSQPATAAPTERPEPTVTSATPATQRPAPTARPTAAPTASQGGTMTDEVFRQVNEYRAQYGRGALTRSDALDRAAAIRADELARQFSHTRPDGSSWNTVSPLAFGENIAKGYRSADRVMAAWIGSEGHRANILRESYGSIGIAFAEIDGVTYWVQLFGK